MLSQKKKSYRYGNNQSAKAIKWLALREKKSNTKIIHARHCREFRVSKGHLVDGFYEDPNTDEKTVYEFHGCFYHGCKQCFKNGEQKEMGPGDILIKSCAHLGREHPWYVKYYYT